ncbi:hypothetical protein [Chromobacterium amazonense]|uniref:Tyrosine specific protein phosphatases domain-containing protein n=1 Tax=Chromobacterium amazonense TaxID=1382803 RepID=A0ABU8V3B2_9NEIS|nr:hypothetical protein [Chromobacterium amazonense]MDQ4541461.1 hypothetical protein [Chromobacterium amazonense]
MALTLNTSYLSSVGLDQRLKIQQTLQTADAHVAREGLGGRMLSWLGQLPLLRNYANVATPDALPMIHCRGGVGRTGTLIAAMELINPDSKASLQRIIADQRTTRNHRMAEDVGQREQLVELAQRQGKAVFEPSDPLYANV